MSDDRQALVDVAVRLFTDLCTPADVSVAEDSGWSPRLWSALSDTGFLRLSVPEERGGSGGDIADACALLRVAGQFAVPLPLVESGLLGGWLVTSAGLALPEGVLSAAPGQRGDTAKLSGRPGAWRFSGKVQRVPWGGHSQAVAMLARSGTEQYVLSAPTHLATVSAGHNLAAEPRDTLSWNDVVLPDDAVALAPNGVDSQALKLRGALGRAALISGALSRVSALTQEYTSQRVQFGRPVSRFQAVQFHLVTIEEEAQLANLASEVAALNATPEPRAFEVASAKSVASEAATTVSRATHQAHGAIGMTKEYELGQLTRRLWSWRDEFGSENHWNEQLGTIVASEGASRLWPRISTGARSE